MFSSLCKLQLECRRLILRFILSFFSFNRDSTLLKFSRGCCSSLLFFGVLFHKYIKSSNRLFFLMVKLSKFSIVFKDVIVVYFIHFISIWMLSIWALFYEIERAWIWTTQSLAFLIVISVCCHWPKFGWKKAVVTFYLHWNLCNIIMIDNWIKYSLFNLHDIVDKESSSFNIFKTPIQIKEKNIFN